MNKPYNMNSPRVSVIMPTRNSEKYLKPALESILKQAFTKFELIIVDDQSTDRTLNIIAGYKDRRIRIISGSGAGISAALNEAVRQARGEYIARMDADDIADPSRLGKQVSFLDDNPEIGVCGTLFQEFGDGDAIHNHMENVRYGDLLMGCYIGHPTAMFRRELFIENQLFYNEDMRFSEDYELWSRAIRVTGLANIPEILLKYRRHGKSASIAHKEAMHQLDIAIKTDMIEYLVGKLHPNDRKILTCLLKGDIVDAAVRMDFVSRVLADIKYPNLCKPLELLSVFHQINPFSRAELFTLGGEIIRDIPIFIISYNNLTYVKSIVNYLESIGINNIHIIDNASTYPPLSDYLDESQHRVHHMGKNYKHMVLFDSKKFKNIIDNEYFILTDPDVLPVEQCPSDFILFFLDILLRNPQKNKVGFSLKIDDIPEHYDLKGNVTEWESRFYDKASSVGGVPVYDAPIDTTFALYRPRKEWRTADFYSAIRTGAPYAARHLPWYRDLNKLSDEELFYRSRDEGSSNWNGTMTADELHRKYNTAEVTNTAYPSHAEGFQVVESSMQQNSYIRNTFKKRRVEDLRGYFLNGKWPLLNLRTVSCSNTKTTLYVFGKFPLMSKTTTVDGQIFHAFSVFPIWRKGK
ncbi:glycosyltransferase [Brucella sp. 2716]|uniref:glycosyltransferase n=1 Tax=Brucella sp. 2716 TaxID=2975052 RepID=UPI00217D13A9|nr:glycosyltransferase [Brucella sp. 2716]UWF59414.1 glycosyltransferase [Brucella sp. 2716]